MLVGTWNMQGGNKWFEAAALMLKLNLDVMCIQECGSIKGELEDDSDMDKLNPGKGAWKNVSVGTIRIGSSSRGAVLYVLHYDFGDSNDRCSLAILSTEKPSNLCLITHQSAGIRPVLGVELASEGIWVCCIHAPSSGGAAGVAQALLSCATAKKWICVGDFNCDPSKITKFDSCSSGSKTQKSGGELDYAVFFNCKVELLWKADGFVSDHLPLAFKVG